ncbi:hypothetical protein [Microbacterium sp. 18062]|nr:hypothetical protein [Microbacterium sp. 18062]
MLVPIVICILITLVAIAATVRAIVTDDPGPRRRIDGYDSRNPTL